MNKRLIAVLKDAVKMTEFKQITPKTAFSETNEIVLRSSLDHNLESLVDMFNAFLKACGYESQVRIEE